MEILNLGNNNEDAAVSKSPRAKKLKVAKAAVGIGTIASLTGLGSTLAANISLNGDANVEFGQGVAQTAACDEDGFTITPVSYYDSDSSTFRLDYVEVSGLNLIPAGADASTASSGSTYWSATEVSYSPYIDASAIAAHPGQYYDASALSSIDPDGDHWVNTCDQVVLDFKAFTDDVQYSSNTLDGYAQVYASNGNTVPNTISSPLFWGINGNNGIAAFNHPGYNSDFAVIFDSMYDSSYNSNHGSLENIEDDVYKINFTEPGGRSGTGYTANSSFKFFADDGHYSAIIGWGSGADRDPIAGAISKITVESMKYFPSNYINRAERNNSSSYDAYGYYYLGSQTVPVTPP